MLTRNALAAVHRPNFACSLVLAGLMAFATPQTGSSFTLPFDPKHDGGVVGWQVITRSQPNDTRFSIAKRYGVSQQHLQALNPNTFFWAKQRIYLPYQVILPNSTPQKHGIVVNLAEKRLYYYAPRQKQLSVYPVSIGRINWRTPLSTGYVIKKQQNPTWNVPVSIRNYYKKHGKYLPRQVPPGPSNPLGSRALYLTWGSILIHGTNEPKSIGLARSSGCIRLYPNSIEDLYRQVPLNTKAKIIYEPYKFGFHQNRLYVEAHQPIPHYDPNDSQRVQIVSRLKALQAAQHTRVQINWQQLHQVLTEAKGIPVPVGQRLY